MYKFGKAVVKGRFVILILSLGLLVPSLLGMLGTRINYDILSYLPSDLDTMKGQDFMMEDFGKGGFAFVMIDGMKDKDVKVLEKKFKDVDHVCDVVWYDSIADINLPKEVIPKKLYDFFNSDNSTLMAVFFDETSAADGSLEALNEIKSIAGKQCFVAGMTAAISDIKDLTVSDDGFVPYPGILYAERRNGCTLQSRFKLLFRRDIVHHAGAYRSTPARCNYRLLHLPVAQLQGAAKEFPGRQ